MQARSDNSKSGQAFSPRAKRVLFPLGILAAVNFFSFFIISLYLGGDALNGYLKDGHYFLGSHGAYTEVSLSVWTYSRWHATSVWFTHGLLFLCAIILTATGDVPVRKNTFFKRT